MMNGSSIPSNETPVIYLRAGGDLNVIGKASQEIRTDPDQSRGVQVETIGGEYHISSLGDLTLEAPHGSQLIIAKVGGDLEIEKISGRSTLEVVGGDVKLNATGFTLLRRVGGDLDIRELDGKAQIGFVGGDCSIDGCVGPITIGRVGGDLELDDVKGSIVANCGGDVSLRICEQIEADSSIRSGGDMTCALEELTGSVININAGGDLVIETPDGKKESHAHSYSFTIGAGGPSVNLMAGGDVDVHIGTRAAEVTPADIGSVFSKGFNAESFKNWAGKYSADRADTSGIVLAGMETEKTQKIIEQAGHRIQTALQKLFTGWKIGEPVEEILPPTSESIPVESFSGEENEPAYEPVSDEERLMVLQMVQDKKITVEEATSLLEMLEKSAGG